MFVSHSSSTGTWLGLGLGLVGVGVGLGSGQGEQRCHRVEEGRPQLGRSSEEQPEFRPRLSFCTPRSSRGPTAIGSTSPRE